MTTNPPYSLDDKTPGDLPDLPVDVDEIHDCDCDRPDDRAYPNRYAGEFDPTLVKAYDKWWLEQCKTCGGLWWTHDARGDYGIPEMDNR